MGPRRTDIILSAAVALALAHIIALAQTDANAAVQPLAYVFVAGFGVILLRTARPRTVAVLRVLGTFANYSLELTPIGVALPVVAALSSLAEAGLTRFAVVSAVIVVATAFRIRGDSLPLGRLLGAESLSTIALLAAAVALGCAVATHRRFAAGQAELLRLQNERLTQPADVRRQRERVEISRDLHDAIGHRLSVISLHADVDVEALEGNAADESVATPPSLTVETRAREASEALTRIRTEAASRIDVSAGEVPAPVETVIVRIVQEGITNVLRHANAQSVDVAVGIDADDVLVTVVDDGDGDGGDDSRGYGLPGMRERVRLMGGRLTTSARPGQGFRLEARVPRRLPT